MRLVMNKIPKGDILIRIADLLKSEFEKEIDFSIMEIRFNVGKNMIQKVNEDFYYRYNNEGEPEPADEVAVTTNGITFKYVGEE